MKGHYTKREAAQVLGVSVRQVSNYLSQGKLTRVKTDTRVYIPMEEVNRMSGRSMVMGDAELIELRSKVDRLERQVEVLTIGLGFGVRRQPMSDAELLLLRQGMENYLDCYKWPRQVLAEVANDLMKIQPEEVFRLTTLYGADALVPFVDLATKQILYIEKHKDFPDKGLDVLRERLIRARDRVFGLVKVSTKVTLGVTQEEALRIYQTIDIPPGAVDLHIAKYLTALK